MSRALLAAVILTLSVTAAAQSISIQFNSGTFRVIGWRPPASMPAGGWESVFTVYAGEGDVPPLLGSYRVDNGTLVFHPQFPVAAGPRYRAVFHPPSGPTIEKLFPTAPDRYALPTTRVEQVYPSGDVLPSNQLRLYIYFSAPMSRGDAEQRIHVLDDAGKPLRGVFLPGQELWDPNNTRLTMTFDPGRIKRDLTSNRAMGPPIAEGKRYTLVIDREWRDANGVPMAQAFRKTFRGGPAVRQPPDPKAWKMTVPAAGTRNALIVDFGRPMNYTLLQRMLHVGRFHGDVGGGVNGKITVANAESQWRFIPDQAWDAGDDYRLVADDALEDLAGNKIGQPFDIDVFEKVTPRITASYTSLPFKIR